MPVIEHAATIGKKYRLLMNGEKTQEGDEGYSFGSKEWFVLTEGFWGNTVVHGGLYRRPLQ